MGHHFCPGTAQIGGQFGIVVIQSVSRGFSQLAERCQRQTWHLDVSFGHIHKDRPTCG